MKAKLKIAAGKYAIIGSEAQVAATEHRCSLARARACHAPARFTTGHPALVVWQARTKAEAANLIKRSEVMLAQVSGRLGRWITPKFTIVETRELNQRMA